MEPFTKEERYAVYVAHADWIEANPDRDAIGSPHWKRFMDVFFPWNLGRDPIDTIRARAGFPTQGEK